MPSTPAPDDDAGGPPILRGRRFLVFCLGAFLVASVAVALMLWVPHPRHGTSERVQGAVIVYGVMVCVVVAVHRRARRTRDATRPGASD